MISDPNVLSITVTADDSVVDANKSVSLGLIVTELVINALKHAFPEHARGKVFVDYHSDGPDWCLNGEGRRRRHAGGNS
jgi:two-component sensor histidine kinase